MFCRNQGDRIREIGLGLGFEICIRIRVRRNVNVSGLAGLGLGLSREQEPCCIKSLRRPGVATTMCTPFHRAFSWGPLGTPWIGVRVCWRRGHGLA